jgi:hypothetical protein
MLCAWRRIGLELVVLDTVTRSVTPLIGVTSRAAEAALAAVSSRDNGYFLVSLRYRHSIHHSI